MVILPKETALDWLRHLGYGSLCPISLFVLYKLGQFELIKSFIHKKLFLFSVKTKVEAPTHIITYNVSVQPLIKTIKFTIEVSHFTLGFNQAVFSVMLVLSLKLFI